MRFATASFFSAALVVGAVFACSSTPPTQAAGAGTSSSSSSGGKSSGSSSSSSGTTNPSSSVVTTNETMDFNGQTRSYLLSKPTKFDASKKYPLVLNLHGNPGTNQDEINILPFDSVSGQDAVVAYPLAANGTDWDWSEESPDFPFIKGIIDELATKASIDPANVLGFGYSGGAYFLSQYACRVGGTLKMVAIVSGGAPEVRDGDQQRDDECVICPGGAVPMLITHGMNDNSDVPFEGGDYGRICWAETNGCNSNDLTDATAPCSTYNGCNKPLTWCPIPNQDHGAWVPSMQRAWDMFKSL